MQNGNNYVTAFVVRWKNYTTVCGTYVIRIIYMYADCGFKFILIELLFWYIDNNY